MGTISFCFFISLVCCGWCLVISEGMLLEIALKLLRLLPRFLAKPLGLCVPCSATGIGSAAYFWAVLVMNGGITKKYLMLWPVVILAVAFLNFILWHVGQFFLMIYLEYKNEDSDGDNF